MKISSVTKAAWLESAYPVAFAVAFWTIIALLIVFAMAEGKNSPFTAFFAAFGAVGQTFFAFMVWRLTRDQFAFNKLITERQTRIDAFQHRSAIFEQWREVSRGLLRIPKDFDDKFFDFFDLEQRARLVYGREVRDAFDELGSAFNDWVDAEDEEQKETDLGRDASAAHDASQLQKRRVRTAMRDITRLMTREVQLEPDPEVTL